MWRGLAVTLLACGRIGFGDVHDGGAPTDTPPPALACVSAGTVSTYDAIGAGTASSPYVICTADQLVDLMQRGAGWQSDFALGNDLDLAGRGVSPIGDA